MYIYTYSHICTWRCATMPASARSCPTLPSPPSSFCNLTFHRKDAGSASIGGLPLKPQERARFALAVLPNREGARLGRAANWQRRHFWAAPPLHCFGFRVASARFSPALLSSPPRPPDTPPLRPAPKIEGATSRPTFFPACTRESFLLTTYWSESSSSS